MSAGPFETLEQAQAVPAVRAALEDARNRAPGVLAEHNRAMIRGALRRGGVELGAFDQQIVDWLANREPHVIAVITSWMHQCAEQRGLMVPDGFRNTFITLLYDGIKYAESMPPSTRGRGQAGMYRAMAREMGVRGEP